MTFDQCLAFTLRWEGGYAFDPDDPGGETNFGITQAAYDRWRRGQYLPPLDVEGITRDEVRAIYQADYWSRARCAELPAGVDLVTFDTAVNCGPGRAVRWLQAAAGAAVDGVIGPRTLEAVRAAEPRSLALAVCDAREAHHRARVARKPSQARFLHGWLNRVDALRAAVDQLGRLAG